MAYHGDRALEKDKQGMTNAKINVMILIVSMPVGGVENQIVSVAQRLDHKKYNLSICCIKGLGLLGEKAAEMGIKTIALDLMKSSRFSLNIPYQISKVLKDNEVHILWTHQYVANLYGRLASLLAKTPVVIATFRALYDSPKIHRSIFNHLLSYKTDKLVAVSKAVAADVTSFDRVSLEKIKIIYNGIDLSLFEMKIPKKDCRKKLGLPENDIIVGSTGRMSREKNHKIIVDAVKRLPLNVKGALIGDGPLRESLEQAGRNKFYFLGQLGYSFVPIALKAMDFYCFPSLWEGMPSALVEAMAVGLPIIASDIPPHREIMGEAGILVPAGNADAFAKAINILMDDHSLRNSLGKKAAARAKMFSIENTVKSYESLFDEVIRGKKVHEAI